MKRTLEIIASSLDDARQAVGGGADRLELCSALALGGLTPSLGTLRAIKKEMSVPVMCMVRPREGGMAYSDGEFLVMLKDAELLLDSGADGLVFGFLHDDGTLDAERCSRLLEVIDRRAGSRPVDKVFHRAFDVVADPDSTLEALNRMGVDRILTSGRAATALQGIDEIRRYVRLAAGRIQILPGGGIDLESMKTIVRETLADQVHLYLTSIQQDRSVRGNPEVYFGAHLPTSELDYHGVSRSKVRQARNALDAL